MGQKRKYLRLSVHNRSRRAEYGEAKPLEHIQWLFFDMGSTLLDETQSYQEWFRRASGLIGGALSPEAIEQEYRAGMARGNPTVTGQLRAYGFTGESTGHIYPSDLDTPYPGAAEVLARLAGGYRLGIIANQKAGSEARLERYGLRQYFDVVAASAEAGFAKPDPRIFTLALAQAGCEASRAAMIGDRPDNDIFPAKSLGFATVRVLQGCGRLQTPKSPEYQPDFTVDALPQLLPIFTR